MSDKSELEAMKWIKTALGLMTPNRGDGKHGAG